MNLIDILLILSLLIACGFAVRLIAGNKGKCASCQGCTQKCDKRKD